MRSIYKPKTKKIVEISLSIAAAQRTKLQPGFGLDGTVPTCCITFTSTFGADSFVNSVQQDILFTFLLPDFFTLPKTSFNWKRRGVGYCSFSGMVMPYHITMSIPVVHQDYHWVMVSNIFYFHPCLGK